MWFRALLTLGVLSYPFFVPFAVRSGHPEWVVALLLFILFAFIFRRFRFFGRLWLSLFIMVGWVLLLAFPGEGWILVLFSVPSLVFATLAWLFARTLFGDRVPAVTRFARVMRESTTVRVEQYTRMATVAWALFFTAMAIQSAMFAFLAPANVWAMFGNILNLGFTAFMFFLEYLFRRVYLRAEPQYGLNEYLRRLGSIDVRKVMES